MARIRATDTRPEMIVRKGLHAAGFRFILHVKKLPGCPDIVLAKHRSVILVHGCFWHGHAGCGNFRLTKTRPDFWRAKIEGNRQRDFRSQNALVEQGWRVLVVWECATRTIIVDRLVAEVAAWLQGTETSAELSSNGWSGADGELSAKTPLVRNETDE